MLNPFYQDLNPLSIGTGPLEEISLISLIAEEMFVKNSNCAI
jgi:hypothetical protein